MVVVCSDTAVCVRSSPQRERDALGRRGQVRSVGTSAVKRALFPTV